MLVFRGGHYKNYQLLFEGNNQAPPIRREFTPPPYCLLSIGNVIKDEG